METRRGHGLGWEVMWKPSFLSLVLYSVLNLALGIREPLWMVFCFGSLSLFWFPIIYILDVGGSLSYVKRYMWSYFCSISLLLVSGGSLSCHLFVCILQTVMCWKLPLTFMCVGVRLRRSLVKFMFYLEAHSRWVSRCVAILPSREVSLVSESC